MNRRTERAATISIPDDDDDDISVDDYKTTIAVSFEP